VCDGIGLSQIDAPTSQPLTADKIPTDLEAVHQRMVACLKSLPPPPDAVENAYLVGAM
jgi:hypothetical protein